MTGVTTDVISCNGDGLLPWAPNINQVSFIPSPSLLATILIHLDRYNQTLHQTARTPLAFSPAWEGKGYHMGPTDDVMREVLLSIET